LTGTDWIDLRSDTVTRPSQAMRDVMASAEVGDDVYGEDPSVNALEAEAASMLGKEAGLFVASGTQSNLIALLTHCGRGDEYIAGTTAHTYMLEGGGGAALGGIQPQTLPFEPDGTLDLDKVESLIKPANVHYAVTRLLCLENTKDGRATGPAYFQRARQAVDRHGLQLHLDGARYFNAVTAVGCDPAAIATSCDSVSICLSKGLGAPVGSVLLGTASFIDRARRWRKMVGGGMRQAGVIASAGLYALTNNVERLVEDHDKAEAIAGFANRRYPGAAEAHSNMVFLDLPAAEIHRLMGHLAEYQIRVRGSRWVVHLDVAMDQLDRIEQAIKGS
jgi:threonine aldolase